MHPLTPWPSTSPQTQVVYEHLLKRLSESDETSDLTLVYVQYMRSMRRTGGTKAMRDVFKVARVDERCSHHAFVAAALMELSTAKNGDKVRT